MSGGVSICLNMIVKNEAHVLPRLIESALPFITHWAIVDTGSTDDTAAVIARLLGHLPGKLGHCEFADFAQSRNVALELARETGAEWALFLDADQTIDTGGTLPPTLSLSDDARGAESNRREGLWTHGAPATYSLKVRMSDGMEFDSFKLVRLAAATQWVGAAHEVIEFDGPVAPWGGMRITEHSDGANHAGNGERLIRMLLDEYNRNPDHPRTVFYLGQSYRERKQFDGAVAMYRKRVLLGGWSEEAWYAQYKLGITLLFDLKRRAEGIAELWRAYNMRPWRAEPMFWLAYHYRVTGEYESSAAAAELAMSLPYPTNDILFVERDKYTWGIAHEYAVAANYSALSYRMRRGYETCLWLASDDPANPAPEYVREVMRANIDHYICKLGLSNREEVESDGRAA